MLLKDVILLNCMRLDAARIYKNAGKKKVRAAIADSMDACYDAYMATDRIECFILDVKVRTCRFGDTDLPC